MKTLRTASLGEKARKTLYDLSFPTMAVLSFVIAYIISTCGLMGTVVQYSVTLAVTGVAVAAFLFTAQSILVAMSSENPFIKAIRKEGHYLSSIHKFCRRSEIVFVTLLLPMLYMKEEYIWFNIILLSAFIFSLSFTVWAMQLIGTILIFSEKHPT